MGKKQTRDDETLRAAYRSLRVAANTLRREIGDCAVKNRKDYTEAAKSPYPDAMETLADLEAWAEQCAKAIPFFGWKDGVPSVELFVERMKREILDDMKKGIVPKTVESFGDLHDYVDANTYGGFCEDGLIDPICDHFRRPSDEEGCMPAKFQDFFNKCQDKVHKWISDGGPAKEFA